jgi:hypothetical protein
MEGQTLDLPTPLPPPFATWLTRGMIEPVRREPEVALAPEAVEQAVARRTGRMTRRRARATTSPAPDLSEEEGVVPVLCPGGTVVCLGGGPSLTPEDVNRCQGQATVIAINDAYRLAPWADVLYAADARWWKVHQGVPSFAGLKYSLQPDAARWPGVQILQNTGSEGLELAPTGLRTGRNGGYQAINLAVSLGATRILLLGYDMQRLPGQPSHWFGEHPPTLRAYSPYEDFCVMFTMLVAPLQQVGVTVINCSRQTALTCFPRMPLEDALAVKQVAA